METSQAHFTVIIFQALVIVICLAITLSPTALAAHLPGAVPQPYTGWLTYNSPHFTFYYSSHSILAKPGEIDKFAACREDGLSKICAYIGIQPLRRIYFYAYEGNEEGKHMTGRTLGWAQPKDSIIHSRIDQTVGHEITHIATFWIADNHVDSAVISEGFATFMDMSGRDPVGAAKELLLKGQLPSLMELEALTRKGANYSTAASFVAYLTQRPEPQRFGWIFQKQWGSLEQIIQGVYGCTTAQMENGWRDFLKNYAGFPTHTMGNDTSVNELRDRVSQNDTMGPTLSPTPTSGSSSYATPKGGYTHLVVFEPAGNFKPQTPRELLDVFHGVCKVKRGYFRTKPQDGILIGSICTDAPETLQKALATEPRLKWIKTVPLTPRLFAEHEARKQESLAGKGR